MSRIRGRNTAPERRLRQALWAQGHRYRLHTRTPVGSPDVVFKQRKVAVFVDGCFWHGCPTHYVRPRSNVQLWQTKLLANVARDRRQSLELERLGWRVVRLWEHDIGERLQSSVAAVVTALLVATWSAPVDWRVVRVEEIDADTRLERRYLEELRRLDLSRVVEAVRSTSKRATTRSKRPNFSC